MIAAAWFLFGVVVGIAFLAICLAWDRSPSNPVNVLLAEEEKADPRDFDANLKARWQG